MRLVGKHNQVCGFFVDLIQDWAGGVGDGKDALLVLIWSHDQSSAVVRQKERAVRKQPAHRYFFSSSKHIKFKPNSYRGTFMQPLPLLYLNVHVKRCHVKSGTHPVFSVIFLIA